MSAWQPFQPYDKVRVTSGTFLDHIGYVMPVVDYMRLSGNFNPMPDGCVPVAVPVFGRDVPVVLEPDQLEILSSDDDSSTQS